MRAGPKMFCRLKFCSFGTGFANDIRTFFDRLRHATETRPILKYNDNVTVVENNVIGFEFAS